MSVPERDCECGHPFSDHLPRNPDDLHIKCTKGKCGCIRYRPYKNFKLHDKVYAWENGFQAGEIRLYSGRDDESWGVHLEGTPEDAYSSIWEQDMILQGIITCEEIEVINARWALLEAQFHLLRTKQDSFLARMRERLNAAKKEI